MSYPTDVCKRASCGHTQAQHDGYTKRCTQCTCARYDWLYTKKP